MRKFLACAVVAVASLALVACAPKATKEQCNAACQKMSELTSAAKPKAAMDDPIKKIDSDFAPKIQDLMKQKEAAVGAIEKEKADKIAAIEKKAPKKGKRPPKLDADIKKVTDEYAKKIDAKSQEFDPQLQKLNKDKADAIKAAQDAKAKDAEKEKTEMQTIVNTCTDNCVKQGVKKNVIDCQMKAGSLDECAKCAK
jgi:hypothetical protein